MTVWRALNPSRANRGVIRSDFKELTDIEKGILVGLIEADGSLGIAKNRGKWYKKGFALYPYIYIVNTDLTLMEKVARILGNRYNIHVHPQGKSHKGRKKVYKLTIKKLAHVLDLLRQLYPYFLSDRKKKKAELIMKFCEIRLKKHLEGMAGTKAWEYGEEEIRLWEECKALD